MACDAWRRLPGSSLGPDQVAACTEAMAALDCPSFHARFAEGIRGCLTEVGSLPDGSPCLDIHQCAGRCSSVGARCGTCEVGAPSYLPASAPVTGVRCQDAGACGYRFRCTSGRCEAALSGLGEPCAPGCAEHDGLVCDLRIESCIQASIAGEGDRCGGGLEPEMPRTLCGPGLVCLEQSDRGVGRCRAPVRDGEACDALATQCLYPARCLDGVCEVPGAATCSGR